MNRDQEMTAVGGITLGMLIAQGDVNRNWRDRTRSAKRTATNAQSSANEALLQVRALLASGDLLRLGSDQVADLMTGLAFPGQAPVESPSAFAGVPASINRPLLTEGMARDFSPWPGRPNLYGADGKLLQPNQAFGGQNFATGLAMGYGEIRSFLLGLAQAVDASPDLAAQYFRFTQGFAQMVAARVAEGGAGALSQAEWKAVWDRVVATSVPGSSGLILSLLDEEFTDGVIITNSTSELTALELEIPANSIVKGGDALNVEAAFTATGVNSTNTHRVRAYLDSSSGTLLWDTSAVNPTAGDSAIIRGQAKAQTVGSTTGKLALGGTSALSGTVKGPANATVTFDNTIKHKIVFTITQSAASTGNTMLARYGQVVLQSAPPAASAG